MSEIQVSELQYCIIAIECSAAQEFARMVWEFAKPTCADGSRAIVPPEKA